ncbi:transcriptional repressor [Geomonas sp. RF6]|uniref:Fur family transcriptional regulator n=1 Tax=Geomonas sp. RF6 TaxID=2897342 RepID=UPI001E4F242D|nr:Fur family transcriptional regulator [Geomonas sp. RF6]UFS72189.1 transcriptional repressor [Geomonas sp. RF6]
MQALRDEGLKLTPQRLLIIDLLAGGENHPSACTLLETAKEKVPKISASTVYYTLNLLKGLGLIKELDFYDRDNRYEPNTADHLNLICLGCGKIEDFQEGVPAAVEAIEERTGFRAHQKRLEYYGYCRDCLGKEG